MELQLLRLSVWGPLSSLLDALARAFPGLKHLRLQAVKDSSYGVRYDGTAFGRNTTSGQRQAAAGTGDCDRSDTVTPQWWPGRRYMQLLEHRPAVSRWPLAKHGWCLQLM